MKLKILSSAVDDLYEGYHFYERQRTGLGDYFFDSLFSDIDSLLIYAGVHPLCLGHYRLLSRRFPYAIYYKLDADLVVVRRVLDVRRDPNYTRNALE